MSAAGRPSRLGRIGRFAERIAAVRAVAEQYGRRKAELAEAICRETGKPRWEALAEVDAMVAKVADRPSTPTAGGSPEATPSTRPTASRPPRGTSRTAWWRCSGRSTFPATCPTGTSCRPSSRATRSSSSPASRRRWSGSSWPRRGGGGAACRPGVFNVVQGGPADGDATWPRHAGHRRRLLHRQLPPSAGA